MPNIQNLSLTDRQTPTSVVHNFTPRDVKSGVGVVVANAGVPLGEERLTISMRKSGSKFKGKLTLALPVVQTQVVNGISSPVLVRTAYANIDVTFDETSTTQERSNLIGMLADSLGTGKVLVNSAFINLESVYGA